VVVLASILLVLVPWETGWASHDQFAPALLALLLIGVLSEASSISLSYGSATSSVAFVPFLAATLLLGPGWSMIIAGLSFLTAEAFVRAKPLLKVLFNTAKEMVAVGLAGLAYIGLGGHVSIDSFVIEPGPLLAMLLVYLLIGHAAVCVAISLSERVPFSEAWARLAGASVIHDLFSGLLAPLFAYLYVSYGLVWLIALAVALFFLRHFYYLYRELEQVNRELLELMVKSIEARDPYTSGHSQRVAKFARLIAREAGLAPRQVEQIATAALLHDVGKIYEEFAPILRKEGKLSAEQRLIMRSHPARSADLVATVSTLRGAVENAVRFHHENFDGGGYPNGLAGEAIPVGARIVMLADTIDAMTTDRPYRRALSYDRVVEELVRYSGMQFDPKLVQVVIHSKAVQSLFADHSVSATDGPPSIRLMVASRMRIRRRVGL
jgi:hypothetical protein